MNITAASQVKVRVPQKQCERVSGGGGGGLQGYSLVGVAGGSSADDHY